MVMYLARVEGTLTTTVRHKTIIGGRLLVGRRLEADGRPSDTEPVAIWDQLGARHGSTVLVSTDGDKARNELGNTTPMRLVVVGIVDEVRMSSAKDGVAA